jgi:hypothetical protein
MTAQLERPAVHLELVAANSGSRPGRSGHQPVQFRHLEVENLADGGHGISDTEDKLHVQGRNKQAFVDHAYCLIHHGEIKDLDLRLDAMLPHSQSELADEVGMVFVDDGRKVTGAGRQRCHIGLQRQHAAAFGTLPGTAAG